MTVVTNLKVYAVLMSGYSQEKSFAVVAETRRKWSAAERKQTVAETEASSVSSVARQHGVATSLVFAGSDTGGERAAAIYSLIETAKLNGLDPEAYLRNILTRIADHPINCIAELLPWRWKATQSQAQTA